MIFIIIFLILFNLPEPNTKQLKQQNEKSKNDPFYKISKKCFFLIKSAKNAPFYKISQKCPFL